MKIRKILISQPEPDDQNSPYFDLARKHKVKLDFKKFIEVQGITAKEFRCSRINILDHTAVIFTSKIAIDHFFRISKELRVDIPQEMKYFCISEATALYLQTYIQYRKRKIFFGQKTFADLIKEISAHLKKNHKEKFLLPLADATQQEFPQLLDKEKIEYTSVVLFRSISRDLSDISPINYDMLVFFSPFGVSSLFDNFPNFKQNGIKIAAFGNKTVDTAVCAGLTVDVVAPTIKAPSMVMALEQFLDEFHKQS